MDYRLGLKGKKSSPSNLELVSPKQTEDLLGNSFESGDSFYKYSSKFMYKPNGHVHPRLSRYSKRTQRRLVYKNGESNISRANIKKRRQRFLVDIFTTLIDIKWRWNLILFILAFTISWLIFAMVWWLICFSHGDFDRARQEDTNWKPCVAEVRDFTTALLFSIETQHTIGYGSRHTTPYCPEAILVMMMQSCFGVIIQALMTGLIFAKLSRPKKRAETLMFSKNAVICRRDGNMCLLFRVGDMRKTHIVEAHVRALMIKKKVTKEGEVLPLYQHELELTNDDSDSRLFLVWPLICCHKIDESSPLWDISAEDMHRERFEIIIILEGIVESTGMTTQARTSYLPGEILWGHRFQRLITFQKENGGYQIDYSQFNITQRIDTPQCSARELAEMPDEPSEGEENDYLDDEEEIEAETVSTSSSSKDKDTDVNNSNVSTIYTEENELGGSAGGGSGSGGGGGVFSLQPMSRQQQASGEGGSQSSFQHEYDRQESNNPTYQYLPGGHVKV